MALPATGEPLKLTVSTPTAGIMDSVHPSVAGRARVWRPIRENRQIQLPEKTAADREPTLAFTTNSRTEYSRRLDEVMLGDLLDGRPKRNLGRHHGQGNKPVAKWTHTTGHRVPDESRYESELLLPADHHPAFILIS